MRKIFDFGAAIAKFRREAREEVHTAQADGLDTERIVRAFFAAPPQWEQHTPPRVDPSTAAVDAARLYGEIRSRAEAETMSLELMKIGGNEFRVLKYQFDRDHEHQHQRCKVAFLLNGKSYTVEAYTDMDGMRREIINRIAELLAVEVCTKLMENNYGR